MFTLGFQIFIFVPFAAFLVIFLHMLRHQDDWQSKVVVGCVIWVLLGFGGFLIFFGAPGLVASLSAK